MYSTNNVQNYPAAIPVYSQPNNVQNYPAEIPVYSLPAQFPPNISQQNPLNVIPIHSQAQYPWSSGLFDCFNDCESCCLTLWCPCITFGRIAEIVSKGSSLHPFTLSSGFCWVARGYTPAPTDPCCGSNSPCRRPHVLIALFTAAVTVAPCVKSTESSNSVDSPWLKDGLVICKIKTVE
ncbi:PREDICTED: uncharacterized protein LOC104607354 isoform X2 [Nelumbo nucifera]|uniref:Uncharacterized protein LOC104607354 isoform X2 n=1 Tax=Nelumbo nucifera TaxID=4432 RepID=A0A1U8AX68_NELNU|nr:PREDICTED: uncharacterized protein LOC104607354 isoform X2 [Nelumbo nucifera]